MTRYHINPDTVRPNICVATGKRGCKYAVDGKEPPHYATKEDARFGYEVTMQASNLPPAMGRGREGKLREREVEAGRVEPVAKVNPVNEEAARRLGALPRMGGEQLSPLTKLNLRNDAFPLTMEAITPMEKAAATYERDGKAEAAKSLRLGGRQLAGADTYVRMSAVASMHSAMATDSYLDGRMDEGDAHWAVKQVAECAMRESADLPALKRWYQEDMKAALTPTEGEERPLPRDSAFSSERGMEAMREEREERRKLELSTPRRTFTPTDSSESYTASELLRGRRDSDDSPITQEHLDALGGELNEEMRREADTLANVVCVGGKLPSERTIMPGDDVEGDDRFKILGIGAEHIAYLSRSTGMVYKIAHNQTASRVYSGSAAQAQRAFEEAYADVDEVKLREQGAENVKTLFISTPLREAAPGDDGEVSVIAQPLLHPREWRKCSLSRQGQALLKRHGVDDLHDGNVVVNLRTGRVMLLDCLAMRR